MAGTLAALGMVASAGPAAAVTAIEVTGAFGGTYVPGRPVPVKVVVSADRLVRGRLEVGASEGTRVAVPVEIPGGSTKELLVVVPSDPRFGPAGRLPVRARLWDGSREIAQGAGVIASDPQQELVGLLPAVLGSRAVPGPSPLSVDAGTARFTALGPAELAQAPASLGPVSTIGAGPDEISRLPVAHRDALLAWLGQGGHLLVDGEPGQTVAGLPDEWQPGADGRGPAGLGEVRLTSGAMAAGEWSGLVEPTGWATVAAHSNQFSGVAQSLASEAGLRLPELRWLVAFLALYVVIAGPVVFLAVRRRGRAELAWVAVPLVALVFTAGSYIGGRSLRHATRLVASNVVTTSAGGSSATTYLGLYSASGETAQVGFPPGWLPMVDSHVSPLEDLTLTPDGAEGRVPLDAGQFVVVGSRGPASPGGVLEVGGTFQEDGTARGTVRNGTSLVLDEVAVLAGQDAARVGSLAPGQEREWSIEGASRQFDPFLGGGPPPEAVAWDLFWRPQPDDGLVDFSLWDVALAEGGPDLRGPGLAVAAGWTRELAPSVTVGGRQVGEGGRTLVTGRSRLAPAATGPGSLDIRRVTVRSPDFGRGPVGDTVVRYITRDADRGGRAPDPSRLLLRAPVPEVEVWTGGAWQPVAPSAPRDLEMGRANEFPIPPEAVQDDTVHVRLRNFGSAPSTLVEAT